MITVLVWSERLLALAILFQTIELLQLKSIWADTGIWRWQTIRKDYTAVPVSVLNALDFLLKESNFHRLLQLRLICSVLVWILHPSLIIFILFLTTWLISIRWRGIFNGGSDSMTALIALSLTIAQFFSHSPILLKACFAYIAIQIIGSYFLAGVAKLKNEDWRRGVALSAFFRTPRYDSPPAWLQSRMENSFFSKVVSWTLIAFELLFPLALLNSELCLVFLSMGFIFHVLNFWVFGLNRFVFAWLAGYPALYYWSHRG